MRRAHPIHLVRPERLSYMLESDRDTPRCSTAPVIGGVAGLRRTHHAFRHRHWNAQGRSSRGSVHEPVRAGSPRPCGDQRDRRGASSPPPRRRSTQHGSRVSLRGRTAGWRPLSGARRSHLRSSWSGQGRRGRHRGRRPTASVPGDRIRDPGPRRCCIVRPGKAGRRGVTMR